MGVLGAVQVSINTAAGAYFGYSFAGTFASFFVGWLILAAILAPRGAAGVAWRAVPPPRFLLPGCFGVANVSASIFISREFGTVAFWVPQIAGSLACAAALDALGLTRAGGERVPLSARRAVSLALALAGAGMAVAERGGGGGGGGGSGGGGALAGALLGGALAGGLMPCQAALNRAAVAWLPSRVASTFWSFSVGVVAAGVALGASVAAGPPSPAGGSFVDSAPRWFMYMGGPLGVVYIASTIAFTQVLGASPFFIALVAGQMTGGAAVDAAGFLGAPTRPLTALSGGGIALTLVAAAGAMLV